MAEAVKRQTYLDSAKAIGILLVILGHTYWIPKGMYSLIYSFHMPLFFIISGYVYNSEKYSKCKFLSFTMLKAKSYILPYFIFAFANLVLQIGYKFVFEHSLINGSWLLHNYKGILLCNANKENMPNCSPIWFLVCLFLATVVMWAMLKYAKRFAPVIAVAGLCISYFIHRFWGVNLPIKLSVLGAAVFFMYLGYVIKEYKALEINLKKPKYLIGFIALFAISAVAGWFNGGNVGMNENNYGRLYLFIIAAVGLSVVVLMLCKNLKILNNRFFAWLGKNTIYIMAFNYFMRDMAIEIYYLIPVIKNYTMHWSVLFLLTTVGCLIAVFACNFIKRLFNKIIKKA